MTRMTTCTRRSRTRGAVALALALMALALAGCGVDTSGSEGSEGQLAIVSTGGEFNDALSRHFLRPFAEEGGSPASPVAATFDEQWTKVDQMTKSDNVSWDVVSLIGADLIAHKDVLHDFKDCAEVPNVAKLGVEGTCRGVGIQRTIGALPIVYNTERFPEGKAPRTWADFYDTKRFPGTRALPNHGAPWEVLATALLAEGVKPKELFPMDLDRAFRKLDEIRPSVKVFWKTGDQSQQILRDEEVVMAQMWSGRATDLQTDGSPIGISWSQAPKDVALWGVLEDSPDRKQAIEFIDFFMANPEQHAAFTKAVNYSTSNAESLKLFEPDERKRLATTYNDELVDVSTDPWVGKNRDMILERWNEWLLK